MAPPSSSGPSPPGSLSRLVAGVRRRSPLSRSQLRHGMEVAGKPALLAALWFARQYRPSFHRTSPVLLDAADRVGVYPLLDHYYEPLAFPSRHLRCPDLAPRDLPGIDLRIHDQLRLLETFSFGEEMRAIPRAWSTITEPYYDNWAFPPADAQVLHRMVRHYRPKRIVEVGSGESTRFTVHALRLNAAAGFPGRLTCIEPFEAPWLGQLGVEVRREKVEELPGAEIAAGLGAGDILFVDSSHVARPEGDVAHLYGSVLPRLAPGVIVHVHDMFTPRGYPRKWVEQRWLWDEQYIVEALLTGNPRLRLLLTVNHLYRDHRDALSAACPAGVDGLAEPSSMWLEVTDDSHAVSGPSSPPGPAAPAVEPGLPGTPPPS